MLTINEENRLRKKVEELRSEKIDMSRLKQQILDDIMDGLMKDVVPFSWLSPSEKKELKAGLHTNAVRS